MPEHILRKPFCPPEEGLISEKQVYATRSGEPMCHNAVIEGRAKERKHMQDHTVFEVVWLSEVGSLTKVRSKWLQDMKGRVVKARFVAQQVAHGERDDVFAGTPPLAVARTLLVLTASRITKRRVQCSHPVSWGCPARPGTLVETRTVGHAQSVDLWARTHSRALSSDGWTQGKVFPGTLYHASHVATSTCHGDDFFVKASLDYLGKVATTQRNHF